MLEILVHYEVLEFWLKISCSFHLAFLCATAIVSPLQTVNLDMLWGSRFRLNNTTTFYHIHMLLKLVCHSNHRCLHFLQTYHNWIIQSPVLGIRYHNWLWLAVLNLWALEVGCILSFFLKRSRGIEEGSLSQMLLSYLWVSLGCSLVLPP